MPHGNWPKRSICQLAIMGTAFGQRIVNVHHFEADGALEATFLNDTLAYDACEDLVDQWIANQKSLYLACLTSDYSMVMVRGQVLERPSTFEHRLTPVETASSGSGTGGTIERTEVSSTAAVLKWRTPQAGKSHRGRTYFGPWAEEWSADGMVTSAGITALNAYRASMLDTYGANQTPLNVGWLMTIYSRPYSNGEYGYVRGGGPNREFYYPPDYAGDSTNVTAGAVDPVLRSQRRRQIGVGA